MTDRSTIFALSSGRPPAAIAVIRISGPQAPHALERLTGRLPQPREAALVRVREPASGEVIDEALALWFPAPASETGEDIAELQLHGGHAVVAGVLSALFTAAMTIGAMLVAGMASSPLLGSQLSLTKPGVWQTLRLSIRGPVLEAFLNNRFLSAREDGWELATYKKGGIGLWSRGTGVVYFDNMRFTNMDGATGTMPLGGDKSTIIK